MSRENVEIVRKLFEAWAHGDFLAGAEAFDPHVVFVIRPEFPEFGLFVGLEGTAEYMRRILAQWERMTVEAKDLRAIGDTVLARVVQHGRGRASGVEGDNTYFLLFTFRGPKVVRLEAVMSEGEALEAVGLAE